jgi:beta-galactosidase
MRRFTLSGIIGAEYPYYRDSPANWQARLEDLKEAGVRTVQAYIPWVHHDTEEGHDFDGSTKDTRDVKRFVQLCEDMGLDVILKPGPFIHAETRNGGYPDRMIVDRNPSLEPRLDSEGNHINWKWGRDDGDPYRPEMITPLGERASAQISGWMKDVGELAASFDNIAGVQLFNEWFNSDCEHVIEHADYSPEAQGLFRKFLEEKYGSAAGATAPADFDVDTISDLRMRLDWADFSTRYYMAELYSRFNVFEEMPIIQNPKSPVPDKRDFTAEDGNLREVPEERNRRKWDTWLAKVSQIPRWGLIYAPTNWAGVLPDDPEARLAYEITIRFDGSKAICGEDNWGFARLYDPRFESARIVLWQTLFGLANGMQGSFVYTAVQGHNLDDNLDNEFMTEEHPYPASVPISLDGKRTDKDFAMK